MQKDKRIIRRPWGRKFKGGWIIQPPELLAALKAGDVAEFGDIHVGTKQLCKLVQQMEFPDQELLVYSNGQLDVSNIRRVQGQKRTGFRKARLSLSIRVEDNAWCPKRPFTTVVIRPRKFA